MSNAADATSKSAIALKAAGFKRIPSWWVTDEQLELIRYMAKQNLEEINAIRLHAHSSDADKQMQMELAWKTKENGDGR